MIKKNALEKQLIIEGPKNKGKDSAITVVFSDIINTPYSHLPL